MLPPLLELTRIPAAMLAVEVRQKRIPQGIRAEAIPAEVIRAEVTPVEVIPAEATPVEVIPAEAIPAETIPVKTIRAGTGTAAAIPVAGILVTVMPVTTIQQVGITPRIRVVEQARPIPKDSRTMVSTWRPSMYRKTSEFLWKTSAQK